MNPSLNLVSLLLPGFGLATLRVAVPEPFRIVFIDDQSAETFKDKVVILGCDGNKIHKLHTPIGELKAHRVFCYGLFDMHTKLMR